MPRLDVDVVAAELAEPAHQRAIVELLDMYAREPTGANQPLTEETRRRLIPGLAAQSNGCHFLAFDASHAIGLAICFFGFSTFAARPLLNIHDLAVHSEYRGRGVGRALLQAVERAARAAGCCKLTLEVRSDNRSAQALYRSVGFGPGADESLDMQFWSKDF